MVFVVECKPDRKLVKSLIPRRRIVHAGNKSGVLRRLTRNYENSIGLIDQDPASHQPPDLGKFREIRSDTSNKLRVLYFDRKRNFIVILCPKLENWIIEASHEANINISEYKLPDDPDELHRIINLNLDKFEKLVSKLKQISNRVRTLQNYLRNPLSIIA